MSEIITLLVWLLSLLAPPPPFPAVYHAAPTAMPVPVSIETATPAPVGEGVVFWPPQSRPDQNRPEPPPDYAPPCDAFGHVEGQTPCPPSDAP